MPQPLSFDYRSPEFLRDPFPVLAAIRRQDPVHRSESLGGWMVTRFADVCAALKNPLLSSDRISPFMDALPPEQQEEFKGLGAGLARWAVFADPPMHTRIRGLFNKAFTHGASERMRRSIEQIARELLSSAPTTETTTYEFISEFAYPLPAYVICEMLGIPRKDIGQIRIWSDEVATFIGLPRKPLEAYRAAHRSNHAMSAYFLDLIREHRMRPRADLLSELISAQENGQSLTEDELVATCNLLLFAAHTTTTHLLGNGLLCLLQHPEQLALLRARPELIDSAVEELLRYDGPIQAVRRTALAPLDLGGKQIETGDLVFLMLNAANRDESVFIEPDRLDVTRQKNRHIAFGFGIHFCVGAALARLEAQLALRVLLPRIGALAADPLALRWQSSFGFRGVETLPIRLTSPLSWAG